MKKPRERSAVYHISSPNGLETGHWWHRESVHHPGSHGDSVCLRGGRQWAWPALQRGPEGPACPVILISWSGVCHVLCEAPDVPGFVSTRSHTRPCCCSSCSVPLPALHLLQPFKHAKTMLRLWATQNQAMGWVWSEGFCPRLSWRLESQSVPEPHR